MNDYIDYDIKIGSSAQSGEIKTTCPKCSHLRKKKNIKCLSVNLTKKVWVCHHCQWSGYLPEKRRTIINTADKKIAKIKEIAEVKLSSDHFNYLKERGISEPVISQNKLYSTLSYMSALGKEVDVIVFDYLKNSKVVNRKYRTTAKEFKQEANAEKILYGFDNISSTTILCEGEIDMLSLQTAGFNNVCSVPDGASPLNTKNYGSKFDYLNYDELDAVEEFIICTDGDAVGIQLGNELARRLGRERCKTVDYPDGMKDANDVLQNLGVDGLKEMIAEAQPYPVEGLFTIQQIYKNLELIRETGMPMGTGTGWGCLDELYSPVESQWTLVTGIPSMGKSEFLDALTINLAENDWIFGVCSPENQPLEWHTTKLLEKKVGKRIDKFTDQEFKDGVKWLNEHYYFILPEEPTLEAVLANASLLVKRYGMRGLVIDPYNEIDHSRRDGVASETEYVSAFLTRLRKFARDYSVHIWLVAHPAKLAKDKEGNYPVPDGYSVSGSAHFYNKADNILAVHRMVGSDEVEVHVQKVRSRWLGKTGMAQLTWDKRNGRFKEEREFCSFEDSVDF